VHPRHLLDRYVPRGAILLTVLTFGSYIMGLVRDRILVRTFGAGEELDAFNAAFVIPELSLGIVVASGVAAPFVPMFMGLRRENEPDAQTFGQTILTLAVLAMGVVSVLLFIFAPLTVPIVASGFGPAQQELYIQLFRVMTLTPIIFAASLVLGEVLVADRRFCTTASRRSCTTRGSRSGRWCSAPSSGSSVRRSGPSSGRASTLPIRVVGIRGTAFRIRARLALQVAGLRDFFRLALPKTASSPIEPLTFLFFTNVASTLVAGSITSVSLARNFQERAGQPDRRRVLTRGLPGARDGLRGGDKRTFGRLVRVNTLSIGLLTTCAAIGLIVIGERAIDVLLGGGLFDAEDVQRTALVLSVFAISIPFESLGHCTAGRSTPRTTPGCRWSPR
jgi:putative peptidoglycan lipid II flippase